MLKCDCTYGPRCVTPPRPDCKMCEGSGFVETREEEVGRLREALEFYADETNYRQQLLGAKGVEVLIEPVLEDMGARARKALERVVPR